jgi:hypothetical protein
MLFSQLFRGLCLAALGGMAVEGASVNKPSLAKRASSNDRLVFAHFMVRHYFPCYPLLLLTNISRLALSATDKAQLTTTMI